MAGFSTKAPGVKGAPRVSGISPMAGPKYQKTVRAPTNFPHLAVSKRDYAKPEKTAEQLPEGKLSFGSTGLTGET